MYIPMDIHSFHNNNRKKFDRNKFGSCAKHTESQHPKYQFVYTDLYLNVIEMDIFVFDLI